MAVSQREVAVAAKEALVTSEARLQRETQQTMMQQQQQLAAEQARLIQLDKELSARSKAVADKEKTLHDRERALVDRERENAAREARLERERAAIERERQSAATSAASTAQMRRPLTAAAGVAAAGKTATDMLLPRLQQRLMLEDTDDLPLPQPQRAAHVPQPPPPRSALINEPSPCPSSAVALGAGTRQPLPKRLAWNTGLTVQQQRYVTAHCTSHHFYLHNADTSNSDSEDNAPPEAVAIGIANARCVDRKIATAVQLTFHRRGRISALGVPDVHAQLGNEAFEA